MEFSKILDVVKTHARAEILKSFRTDSCIATTRLICRLFRHYGIACEPLPVRAHIYNKSFQDNVRDNPWAMSPEAFRDWCERTGAWSVGLGVPNSGEDIVGHYIAYLPDKKLLIDASIDQASRPHKGIHIDETLIFPAEPEFLEGKEPAVLTSDEGVSVMYTAHLENKSYKQSPDWLDKSRTQPALRALIDRLEK